MVYRIVTTVLWAGLWLSAAGLVLCSTAVLAYEMGWVK